MNYVRIDPQLSGRVPRLEVTGVTRLCTHRFCRRSTRRGKSHELEQAIIEDLAQLRLPTPEIAAWFRTTLEESLADLLSHQRRRAATLTKRKSELVAMQDRLLNAYPAGTVDDDAFKAKTAELKAGTARVTEEIDAQGDVDPARGKTVLDAFDWSQKAAEIWRGSNTTARRQILDSICLNRQVSDVTLVTTKRKPFDILAEGLISKKSRGDCQAFEPLVPEFIDVLLNPGPYLHQIQRFARRMNPALALSERS